MPLPLFNPSLIQVLAFCGLIILAYGMMRYSLYLEERATSMRTKVMFGSLTYGCFAVFCGLIFSGAVVLIGSVFSLMISLQLEGDVV